MLNTPVGICVFNKPHTTERVWGTIADAKPAKLFVFGDSARSAEEAVLCEQTRAIVENVDWDCDVKYNWSTTNLGCRYRYSSGVDWVFSHVDEAIILDDDFLPNPSFYPFCAAMLERYRDDPRVVMVSGANYLGRWKADRQSYHFSLFGSVWGWASWKRAWCFYDVTMAGWGDAEVKSRVRHHIADDEMYEFQARRFDRLYSQTDDRHSWDLPWSFARLAHAGLAIVPAVNLVVNIDERGVPADHPLAMLPLDSLPFPLRRQEEVVVDREYDVRHMRLLKDWWDPQTRATPDQSPSQVLRRLIARRLRPNIARVLKSSAC